MYDTATHVKMVKKRIRQMRRRRETRKITALYAACTLLSAALVGAADTFAGPKQAALSGIYGSMLLHEGAGGYVLVGVLRFTGCYSTVKKYVRKKKYVMKTLSAGYLPLEHPKGWGQVDFGLAEGEWAATGERFPFYALTISFPGSNNGVTQAFPSQNQECLLEGMKRIFEHIGGVPPRLRFDNMTTAVAQVLKDGERVLTEGFTRFMLHYRFQADFCNPASGNEKGNVENKVGYSRRNAFVPVPVITSFEEFNEQLLEWCEKDADRLHYKHKVPIRELWEEDKAALLELPQYPFSVCRRVHDNDMERVSQTAMRSLSPREKGGKEARPRRRPGLFINGAYLPLGGCINRGGCATDKAGGHGIFTPRPCGSCGRWRWCWG